VRVAVQAVLAALIFGFLVITVASQWSELREEGVEFDVIWLLPAFLTLIPFYALNALGWDLILRVLGYRLSPVRAQVAWGQPLLARYVPGSVLYLLGRLVLSEREGVPRRICLASIVYEQALSAAAAVTLASYFFISHPDLEGEPWRWAVLAVVPIALALLQPRVFGPLAERVLRAFGRDPLPRTMPPRAVLAMFAYYLANWTVIGVGVFFVARSVHGFELDDLPTLASAQAIGFLAALFSLVAPAGLGVRDAAFAWAVKATLPSRSFAVGAVIAIAVRAVLTIVEVIYVALVTAIAQRSGAPLPLARSEPERPAPNP
jgi:glycosyltransferase 2 family protein